MVKTKNIPKLDILFWNVFIFNYFLISPPNLFSIAFITFSISLFISSSVNVLFAASKYKLNATLFLFSPKFAPSYTSNTFISDNKLLDAFFITSTLLSLDLSSTNIISKCSKNTERVILEQTK